MVVEGEEEAVGGSVVEPDGAVGEPRVEEEPSEVEIAMERVAVWVETGESANYRELRKAVARGASGGRGSWREGRRLGRMASTRSETGESFVTALDDPLEDEDTEEGTVQSTSEPRTVTLEELGPRRQGQRPNKTPSLGKPPLRVSWNSQLERRLRPP